MHVVSVVGVSVVGANGVDAEGRVESAGGGGDSTTREAALTIGTDNLERGSCFCQLPPSRLCNRTVDAASALAADVGCVHDRGRRTVGSTALEIEDRASRDGDVRI